MTEKNYQDRSFGETQAFGTVEAPDLPEMPAPSDVVKERAEEGLWTHQAKLKAMADLDEVLSDPDLEEAWLLNWYTPHSEKPKDLAEAFHALVPDMKSDFWGGFGFTGKMEALTERFWRYLLQYRRDQERVTGQELAEVVVDLKARVEVLESKLVSS